MLKRNRELTLADYESLGHKAIATFETVASDLEVAAEGMAQHHALIQQEVNSLLIQQAAVQDSRAKFSKAAIKVRSLVN